MGKLLPVENDGEERLTGREMKQPALSQDEGAQGVE